MRGSSFNSQVKVSSRLDQGGDPRSGLWAQASTSSSNSRLLCSARRDGRYSLRRRLWGRAFKPQLSIPKLHSHLGRSAAAAGGPQVQEFRCARPWVSVLKPQARSPKTPFDGEVSPAAAAGARWLARSREDDDAPDFGLGTWTWDLDRGPQAPTLNPSLGDPWLGLAGPSSKSQVQASSRGQQDLDLELWTWDLGARTQACVRVGLSSKTRPLGLGTRAGTPQLDVRVGSCPRGLGTRSASLRTAPQASDST